MKKILLTGGSGFLGGNFCRLYAHKFEINAIWHKNPIPITGINSIQLDICDSKALEDCLKGIKPDTVLHFGAYSDPNQCQLHPDISEKVNIEASEKIATLCREMKIPIVFTSTDLVFDGKSAPYKETDIPCPVSTYGLHKSIAEQSVLDIYPQATVCRLPLMFGPSPWPEAKGYGNSFLQPMLKKLSSGEAINLFTDEFRSVASARDICAGILLCMDRTGEMIHLGGDERISRYEFGKLVCKVFGFDKELLIKSKRKEVQMPALRPKDVSLNNQKAKDIGWQPGKIIDELKQIKEALI